MASNGKIGIEKGALLGGILAYLNSQVKEDQCGGLQQLDI
jgi:hypothetical protein